MSKKRTKGNGEGTVYNNGKYWVGQITIGRDFKTGKIKRKTVYGKTKREVNEKITQIKYELNNSYYIEPSSMTVSAWAVYWLDNFKKPELQDSTYARYKRLVTFRICEPFKNIKLKDLTSFQLQDYFNSLCNDNLRDGYIKDIYKKLNSILNKAVELELIKKNPCHSITVPKLNNKKEMLVFTKEEQLKFVKACYENFDCGKLFIFLLGTGCRVGEAIALTWNDIDFQNNFISINKTAVEVNGNTVIHDRTKTPSGKRTIPVSKVIHNLLEEIYIKSDKSKNTLNLVFPSSNYTLIKSSNLRWKMKSCCKAADIKQINIHALRHTFATRAIEQDINVKVLSEILGHKDITITLNTYAHVLDEVKKEKLLKIDVFK